MSVVASPPTDARASRVYARMVALALGPPLVVLALLLANPSVNRLLLLPVGHFFIVTNVSLVAAGVALLVARAAVRGEQVRVVVIALGFMAMAGLFAVHGLATPGMLASGTGYGDPSSGDYSGTVVGLSAYLSLFVPSLFFASAYTPTPRAIADRLPGASRILVVVMVLLLVGYGAAAIQRPEVLAALAPGRPPYTFALAAASVMLMAYAAWRQMQIYARTRLPMQGALAVAFLFLAQAQIVMAVSTFWTLAWWEYHVLMLAAVVMALGALFLELDRRRGLERFLPAEVVDHVVAGDVVRLAGERRVVTVLFADLRGSTDLAEGLAPEETVGLINEYVSCLARSVFTHGGMLDKFLGDGIMAIFGVVPDPTSGALPAIRAATSMRQAVGALNAAHRAAGRPGVGFGIGMHTGEVVLGTVGIPQRADFTAIGDTVNVAARLETVTKDLGTDIVLSEQTASRLSGSGVGLADLGEVPIRGRTQPIRVFTPR